MTFKLSNDISQIVKEIRVKNLIWDKWNIQHIVKHDLSPRQTEEIFHDRNRVTEKSRSGRIKIIGKCGKRMITVVIVSSEGKNFYVVTARDSNKKEREFYRFLNSEINNYGKKT